MVSTIEIERKIKEKIHPSHLEVVDLRGGDHIQVIVVSKEFENKSLVEQHKLIYGILQDEMKSNEIHALALKTYSPLQWDKIKGSFTKDLGHSI